MRILHTMLRVGDLERSLAFYTEVLGMRLLRRHDYPDGKFTLAFVGVGNGAAFTKVAKNMGVPDGNVLGAFIDPTVSGAITVARTLGEDGAGGVADHVHEQLRPLHAAGVCVDGDADARVL